MRKDENTFHRKWLRMLLMAAILVMMLSANVGAKPSFEVKSVSLLTGQIKTVRLKNNNKRVVWTSSNKKVVRIISKSRYAVKIKGVKKGTATISAKVGGKKYSFKAVVKKMTLANAPASTIVKLVEKKFEPYGGVYIEEEFVKKGNKMILNAKFGLYDGIWDVYLIVNLKTGKVTTSFTGECGSAEGFAYELPRLYAFLKKGFTIKV